MATTGDPESRSGSLGATWTAVPSITTSIMTGSRVAATIRWDITEHFHVAAGAGGIYLGNYGGFFDAAAEIGVDFSENLGLYGGYRWMHAEADVSDVDLDINLRGFFAGLEIRF